MASQETPTSPAVTPEVVDQHPPGNGHAKDALALKPQAAPLVVTDFNPDDPVSMYMNTSVFAQLQRVGKMMAYSQLVPAHLQGEDHVADCALVAAQAFRWRMDPLAVAAHTFVLDGKLGYEGKLVAAVINTSGRLKAPLRYLYSGDKGKPSRSVTVVGTLRGEDEARDVDGDVMGWATDRKGSPWSKPQQHDQQLAYRGAREWARRHAPELMLGIQTEDDIAAIVERERPALAKDVTPPAPQAAPAPDPLLSMAAGQQPASVVEAPKPEPAPDTTLPQRTAKPKKEAPEPVQAPEPTKPVAEPCPHALARSTSMQNGGRLSICGCGVEFINGEEIAPLAGPEE
jgi:hypothetical protein